MDRLFKLVSYYFSFSSNVSETPIPTDQQRQAEPYRDFRIKPKTSPYTNGIG